MKRLQTFAWLYRLYRHHHGRRAAARYAWMVSREVS